MSKPESSLATLIESYTSALTVLQFAKIMGYSKQLVYKMVANDVLPHMKPGGVIRLDPGLTAAWVREQLSV